MNRDTLKNSVIRTLLYYDLFKHPLKADEIYSFLGTNGVTEHNVTDALDELVKEKLIFKHGIFFSLHNNDDTIHRRIKGNQYAEKFQPLALKQAKRISRFPFVRAVMASGSFSKGYMDDKSDLDFFVVTAPGRLWIARILIVLFKRLFYFNSHKYFCCNYFVDTDHLEIEEKNLFTATELATLIPLYNADIYEKLINANRWVHDFFPNYKRRSTENVLNKSTGSMKRWIETLLKARLGEKLDHYFMLITLNRWKRIYQRKYSNTDFNNAFKSKKHVSKNHPRHYQRKVIDRFEDNLRSFSEKYNYELKALNPRTA